MSTRYSTALLVMDVQNDFCHPEGLWGSEPDLAHVPVAAAIVVPRMVEVARACKAAGVPVVTTQLRILADLDGVGMGLEQFRPRLQDLYAQRGFRLGTWGQDLVDAFQAPDVAPDYRVEKYGFSAMYLTGLEKVLRSLGVEELVLMGMGTNGVVEGTARELVSRGWRIRTLVDCVAAPQAELHEAALLNLGHLGEVSTSDDLLASVAA